MVMIIAVAIVTGFQQQIRDKITGFGAHIQIARFNSSNSFEYPAVNMNQAFYSTLKNEKGIRHIQVFATKAGIVQTEDQIQGVVLKGVGDDFDWSFFKDKLVEGRTFEAGRQVPNDSVLISHGLAKLLKLKTGDPLRTYFIMDQQARGRRFIISGIYNTGLEEFDKLYVFGDIRQIQKLNGWDSASVSGFEVMIDDFDQLEKLTKTVYGEIGYELDARSIRDIYPQLFDWLELQDMNVLIILVLMVLVSAIAMISTLLVLILERTSMIGLLKALGMKNAGIRKVFFYHAVYIIGQGLLIGNFIGIGLCLLQHHYGIIRLPEASYFMNVVPIHLDILQIIILNIGTLVICSAFLILPSFIVARISPVKAIRME